MGVEQGFGSRAVGRVLTLRSEIPDDSPLVGSMVAATCRKSSMPILTCRCSPPGFTHDRLFSEM